MESENDGTQQLLYFASTQIQSRYEEDEEREKPLLDLKKFKRTSPNQHKTTKMAMNAPRKKAAKPRAKAKKAPSILSLNAFVKEAYGNRNKPDPLSIVDFFAGDIKKVNEFLRRIDDVYEHPPPTANLQITTLQKHEWESFLTSIRLKFPNLSSRNRKTLSRVSQQLRSIQRSLSESSENLESIWSQASRQPSDELTTEDIKWLYDIEDGEDDEVHLNLSSLRTNDEDGVRPFYLTLSQAMNDSRLSEAETDNEEIPKNDSPSQEQPPSPVIIHDSESEPEPFEPTKSFGSVEEIPSHQVAGPPESCDVLTSIAFKTKPKRDEFALGTQTQPLIINEDEPKLPTKSNDSVIFSSPVKLNAPLKTKTPTKWPSNLVITSSPVSSEKGDSASKPDDNDEELFATARSVFDDCKMSAYASQSQTIESSLPPPKRSFKKRSFKTSTIEFQGSLDVPDEGPNNVKMRKLNLTKDGDEVADSEESDCEVSLIEISRPSDPIEPPKPKKMPSILQVPSSPRQSSQPSGQLSLMQIPMKNMRDIFSRLGLAPTKLKATMATTLEYAFELTGLSIDDVVDAEDCEEMSRKLGEIFTKKVHEKITTLIKLSEDLHMKIALFEPVHVETLAQHLEKHEVFPISLDLPFLQKYCDANGVSTTAKQA